jgi:hypothetical protein
MIVVDHAQQEEAFCGNSCGGRMMILHDDPGKRILAFEEEEEEKE